MVGSLARDAFRLCSPSLRRLGVMLRRYCATVWWFRVDCAWLLASLVARAFNSIWRGVGFGCDPPPFGWFPVDPGSLWVASVLVRHDRRLGFEEVRASLHASRCTPPEPACQPVRALTVCSGSLAGRVVRAHCGMPRLDAVLDSPRVIVRPCNSFNLHMCSGSDQHELAIGELR
jgi:hypothetical protein